MNFLTIIRRVFRAPDLRKKLLVTLLLLLVFRIIAHIPVPGIDPERLKSFFSQNQYLGLLDVFSGGSLTRFSIAAMGVNPYINATIIVQLLTMIVPKLEEISKDGERGRHQMNQYMRYLTVPLAAIQAFGLILLFKAPSAAIFTNLTAFNTLQIIITLTVTSIILMWIGELITESGIGNGISLLIFAGIVGRIPIEIRNLAVTFSASNMMPLLILGTLTLASIFMVVIVNEGQRKIPVTYAKRIRGNRMYGGANTHIPLKVNTAGVIPIIFALSIMSFPTLIANFFTAAKSEWIRNVASFVVKAFDPQSLLYYGIYFVLVIGFTYFYTLITFNPVDVADNLKKQGGFVPGIRPGQATVQYLSKILNRITLAGALFLGVIAVMPFVIQSTTKINSIVGGTSLLILVSVILETMRQMEAQLIMRDYEHFLER